MKMNIYLPILQSGWIDIDQSRHLHSLHPKIGDIYSFTDLNGSFGKGKILEINKKMSSYNISILGVKTVPKSQEKILFQHQTDKLYLEKLVELMPIAGVTKIYIYCGDFSPKQNLQTQRLSKIIIRSCEQSHNLFLPEIIELKKEDWFQKIKEYNPKWLHQIKTLVENLNSRVGTVEAIQSSGKPVSPQGKAVEEKYPYLGVKPQGLGVVSGSEQLTSCLVGPEGGFSQKEEEIYSEIGLEKLQLGENISPAWLAGYTYFTQNLA